MITWTDDLSVGLESIDTQHKELIAAVNRLTDAMFSGKGAEETGKLLSFLGDYVVQHFGAEEKLMVRNQYPGYEAHKETHDNFVKEFLKIKSQYDRGEMSSSLAIGVLDGTWEWLRRHIRGADRELGSYIRQRGI